MFLQSNTIIVRFVDRVFVRLNDLFSFWNWFCYYRLMLGLSRGRFFACVNYWSDGRSFRVLSDLRFSDIRLVIRGWRSADASLYLFGVWYPLRTRWRRNHQISPTWEFHRPLVRHFFPSNSPTWNRGSGVSFATSGNTW
jgi:hypothetical protein